MACGSCPSGHHCLSAQCQPDYVTRDGGPPDACTPPDPSEACLQGLLCGTVHAYDSCGLLSSVECGGCPPGYGCNPAHQRCEPYPGDACTPETDAEFCRSHMRSCGVYTGIDSCSQWRTVACGTCPSGYHCGTAWCEPDGTDGGSRDAMSGPDCGCVYPPDAGW